jgi:hypothetical protein
MRSFRQAGTPGAGVWWSGLACVVGLALGLPVSAQPVRSTWVERVPVTAEVVPMPARFGPLVATMIEATAPSPFGTGSIGRTASPPPPLAAPAPATGTIAVSAVPLTEGAPGSAPAPGQTVPATDRPDLPPLMEPTGTHGVVQSYLVAAAGSAALSAAPAAQVGVPAPARAIIRVHDGHSGRSVVMASREGVGDGRLVITVVFN